ncbi:toxin-activating lysine-acyltransferase [Chromobacterium sp. TRC.1.1.SA]|uniref:RTX toxin-activating lysine-acyltransferase n=1 Tax=Chromobacterium indicum TaxID=3110228 RepID=A0ABV0CJ17_9NEIS
MLGGVMLLSQHSPLHRRYSVSEWSHRILPAFELGQFCYYEDNQGRPVAFCNWALVSIPVRNVLLSGERDLISTDWQSGDFVFFPEMIAPFGHARTVVRDLRQRVFASRKGQQACTVRGAIHEDQDCCVRKVQWFLI